MRFNGKEYTQYQPEFAEKDIVMERGTFTGLKRVLCVASEKLFVESNGTQLALPKEDLMRLFTQEDFRNVAHQSLVFEVSNRVLWQVVEKRPNNLVVESVKGRRTVNFGELQEHYTLAWVPKVEPIEFVEMTVQDLPFLDWHIGEELPGVFSRRTVKVHEVDHDARKVRTEIDGWVSTDSFERIALHYRISKKTLVEMRKRRALEAESEVMCAEESVEEAQERLERAVSDEIKAKAALRELTETKGAR